MPDLFVLAHTDSVASWQLVAGPLEAADVAPAVTRVVSREPTARAVVVRVIRSFRGTLQVIEDAQPTTDK